MKKLIAPLLAAVLLVGGAAAYFAYKPVTGGRAAGIAGVLPAAPLGYGRFQDMEAMINGFTATQFWQGIKNIDYRGIMEKTGASPEETARFDKTWRQFSESGNQKLFMQFFGQEAVIAVYPASIEKFDPQAWQELSSHVYFVTRLRPEMQMAEFFSRFFGEFSAEVQSEEIQYKGHTIKIVKADQGNVTIGYVRIKDYFVFGIGDRAAKDCIDVLSGEKKSLAGDPQFLKAQEKFMPGSKGEIYLDFAMVAQMIREQMLKGIAAAGQEQAAMIQKQMEDTFQQMKGFRTLSYSWVPGEISQAKMDFIYNADELDPDIRQMYNCPARDNATLKFVPDGALAYQWSACYDMKFYYRQILKEIGNEAAMTPNSPPPEQIVAGIEQTIQLSIENDILPAFADEIGGYLGRINTEGMFPIPELTLFVKIADRAKAEHVITTLLSLNSMFMPETESHGGTEIHFLNIPMVTNAVPGYAFVGDYLLISTHKDSIARAADTSSGSSSPLTASPAFKLVDKGLTGKTNYVFFVHFEELMTEGVKLVDWGNAWAGQQVARQEAFRAGTEKRLQDLKSGIEAVKTEIQSMRTELETLNTQIASAQNVPQEAAVPAEGEAVSAEAPVLAPDALELTSQRSILEKRISLKEGELASDEGSVSELEEILKEYDENAPDPQAQQVMTEELIKPLMKSFSYFRVMGSKASFVEGAVESFAYWKLE